MAESSLGSILLLIVIVLVMVNNITSIISLGVKLRFNGFRERPGFGIQKGRHEIDTETKGSQLRRFSQSSKSRKNGRLD
jgi:hypothetical protein